MLLVASTLKNDTIEATDGRIGTVSDFLLTTGVGKSDGWWLTRETG